MTNVALQHHPGSGSDLESSDASVLFNHTLPFLPTPAPLHHVRNLVCKCVAPPSSCQSLIRTSAQTAPPPVVGSTLGRTDPEKMHRSWAIWAGNSWVPVTWNVDLRTYSEGRGTSREKSENQQNEVQLQTQLCLSSVTLDNFL